MYFLLWVPVSDNASFGHMEPDSRSCEQGGNVITLCWTSALCTTKEFHRSLHPSVDNSLHQKQIAGLHKADATRCVCVHECGRSFRHLPVTCQPTTAHSVCAFLPPPTRYVSTNNTPQCVCVSVCIPPTTLYVSCTQNEWTRWALLSNSVSSASFAAHPPPL